MEQVDVAVIGGGQSGLAAAHALLRHGLTPVVLKASARPAGSWPRY
ncbi:FAD-dependent oxidoreductase [Actinacidiphila oryziradicis]|nr:FAD-dependent oxidoreductase [Actinacidiphila oryziradicis]